MRAQEISFMVLCIVVSMGIVNYWGGFSSNDGGIKVNASNEVTYSAIDSSKEGISQLDNGSVVDANDLANQASGWSMLFGILAGVYELLKYLLLPYPYLISVGVPYIIATAIQTLLTAVEGLGIIQLWRGIGFKSLK